MGSCFLRVGSMVDPASLVCGNAGSTMDPAITTWERAEIPPHRFLGPGGQRPSELGLTTTTSYYLVVFVDGGSCTVAVIYRSRSTLLRRKPPKQVPSSHHLSPILHS